MTSSFWRMLRNRRTSCLCPAPAGREMPCGRRSCTARAMRPWCCLPDGLPRRATASWAPRNPISSYPGPSKRMGLSRRCCWRTASPTAPFSGRTGHLHLGQRPEIPPGHRRRGAGHPQGHPVLQGLPCPAGAVVLPGGLSRDAVSGVPGPLPGVEPRGLVPHAPGPETVLGEVQRLGGQIGEVFAGMLEENATWEAEQ